MNDNSIVATQAGSLIRELRDRQQRKCRELQREAESWRREHLREARRQAHEKVRAAVRVARQRRRVEIAAAEAQIEAEQRRERQMQLNGLLSRVIERVPDELRRRWRGAQTRHRWIEATLGDALRRLGASDWSVRHAPGLEPEERVEQFEQAHLTWVEDPDLDAGLVVQKPGARLDASIDGLLSGGAELQSRILLLLKRDESGDAA
jgi:hypothetical protein